MKRVLIADSDPASRQAFNLLITQKLGVDRVYEAGDTETLIKTLEKHPVDILLLDWKLYGAPAPETCRLLLKAYLDLKIILLSVDADDCRLAQAAGAEFIHKGSNPDQVMQILGPWLESLDR
jgi:DNA-binding NarL/FixJ family response regulator